MSTNQTQLRITMQRMVSDRNKPGIKLTKFKKMPSQSDLDKYDSADEGEIEFIDTHADEDEIDSGFLPVGLNTVTSDCGIDAKNNEKCGVVATLPKENGDVVKNCSAVEVFKCPKCHHERNLNSSNNGCLCMCHMKGKPLLVTRTSFPLDASVHMKRFDRAKTLDVITVAKSLERDAVGNTSSFFDSFKTSKMFDFIPAFAILDLKSRKAGECRTLPIMPNSRLSSRRNSTSLTLPDLKARRKSEMGSHEFIRSHSARARRSSDYFNESATNLRTLPTSQNKDDKLWRLSSPSIKQIKTVESIDNTEPNFAKTSAVISKSKIVSKDNEIVKNNTLVNKIVTVSDTVVSNATVITNCNTTQSCQLRKISDPLPAYSRGDVRLRRNSASDVFRQITNVGDNEKLIYKDRRLSCNSSAITLDTHR